MKDHATNLIEKITAELIDAIESAPPEASEMDIVNFAIERLDEQPSVDETAWEWSRTEAFVGTALGILQTIRALAKEES